jgi:hypothetical protein
MLEHVAGEDRIDRAILKRQANAVIAGVVEIGADRMREDRHGLVIGALIADVENDGAGHVFLEKPVGQPQGKGFRRFSPDRPVQRHREIAELELLPGLATPRLLLRRCRGKPPFQAPKPQVMQEWIGPRATFIGLADVGVALQIPVCVPVEKLP